MTGKCINKNHLILGSSDHRWTWLHWSRWVIKTSKIWGYQWYCAFTLLKFDNCLILFCCEKVTLLVPFNSIKASNKIRIEPPLCVAYLCYHDFLILPWGFGLFVLFLFLFFCFFFVFCLFFCFCFFLFRVHVGCSQFLQSTLSRMICMEISSAQCKYWVLTAAKRNIIT